MEQTRFELGLERLKEVDGAGGETVVKSMEEVAPDLGRYIVEFAFGDIYSRSGLSMKKREMITLASLLTAGNLR